MSKSYRKLLMILLALICMQTPLAIAGSNAGSNIQSEEQRIAENKLLALSPRDKSMVFIMAAEQGNKYVLELLLGKVKREISPNDKGMALSFAAAAGQYDVVKLLLNKVRNEIPANFKGGALIAAAREGHKSIMGLLLDKLGNEISVEDKKEALEESTKVKRKKQDKQAVQK